ncbi:NAD-dependent epimerase/dehydratase family protein [Halomonas sp. PA5]|nr:NAD-dependent epimerase/dehydratase family protein [Halomonas sp. PA5]
MRILITGGTGFIGKRIARHLLEQGSLEFEGEGPREIGRIILFDAFPGEGLPQDPRLELRIGDIDDTMTVGELARDVDVIWHLAAVVSSAAEADFDLGMDVNLYGLLNLLEALRAQDRCPRLVYASGFAVFGGELPETVQEHTALTPTSSYGTQKAIGELLVADYSRRGFVDGRTLRLPTIAVRPGKPNKAASTFVSSIIREPLNDERAVCPVTPDTAVFISSPRRALEAMLHAMALSAETLGQQRTIALPGLTVTIAQMVEALERVAGTATRELIDWVPDAEIQRIVESWPVRAATPRAEALGFQADDDIMSIVQAHIEDEGITLKGDKA